MRGVRYLLFNWAFVYINGYTLFACATQNHGLTSNYGGVLHFSHEEATKLVI